MDITSNINELLGILGRILNEVRLGQYLGFIIEEMSNISKTEQVRFFQQIQLIVKLYIN